MSGIFVDDNDLIEITARYTCVDGVITIIEEDRPDVQSLTMKFRRPSFGTSQAVLSSSTMLGQDGQVAVNMMALRNNILYTLAKSWDAKDEKGDIVPLNAETITNLRVEIAKAIIEKLLTMLGSNVF